MFRTVPGRHQVLGLYRSYPHKTALASFELAQQEVITSDKLLKQGDSKGAAVELAIAHHDMDTAVTILKAPLYDTETYPGITGWTDVYVIDPQVKTVAEIYTKIPQAISAIEKEQANVELIQRQVEQA